MDEKLCPLSMMSDELARCSHECKLYDNGKCLLAEALKKIASESKK